MKAWLRKIMALVTDWIKRRREFITVLNPVTTGATSQSTQSSPKPISNKAPLTSSQRRALKTAFRTLIGRYPDLADYTLLIENNEILAFWIKLRSDYRWGVSERTLIREALLDALKIEPQGVNVDKLF